MIPGGTILNIERGQWQSILCLRMNVIRSKKRSLPFLDNDDI